MNNCIKSISKIYLIMLLSVVSFLVTSDIFIFAAEDEQQQQTVTITSDSKDSSFFPFFEQIKNKTESAAIVTSPNVSEKVKESAIMMTSPNVSEKVTESPTDYNFIATGDFYCNEESKKTISNIIR